MIWCVCNKVRVNTDNTKFMLISSKSLNVNPMLYIDNRQFSTVSQCEYLGMLLENL